MDILPPGKKAKTKKKSNVKMRKFPITIIRPAEVLNSIWMNIEDD